MNVSAHSLFISVDAPWRIPTGGGIRGRCM